MFLGGGTLEYAVFVAWYSRKKDQQKSKNNLCSICYGKKICKPIKLTYNFARAKYMSTV